VARQKPSSIDDGGRLRRTRLDDHGRSSIFRSFSARCCDTRASGSMATYCLPRWSRFMWFVTAVRIRQSWRRIALVRPAYWLGGLLLVQLSLGTAAYLGKFTALLPLGGGAVVLTATTHLIVGALMLATSLTITLRVFQHSRRAPKPGPDGVDATVFPMSSNTDTVILSGTSTLRRAGDFVELAKPRVVFMVLITTFVGFYLSAPSQSRVLDRCCRP
jgi:hypothetical protein